ncbi:MAG TPA: sigma-70 family RNA polymerase sigma factor [Gemmataceae bacterium]|jgi:RNA polymerase sigma-70 factor (ECF subfamily)
MDGDGHTTEDRLAAARAGSPDALGAALESCRAYLLLVAEKEMDPRLKAKGGASDLVQQTFLEAQQAFPRFHGGSEAELLAWLRRLLLNNVATFRRHWEQTAKRRASREVGLGGDSTAPGVQPAARTPTPSREVAATERAAAVRSALARLPEDYRTVLTLRYEEDLPFEEVARRMGRTSNAVRKLWARAVERLEQELDGPP